MTINIDLRAGLSHRSVVKQGTGEINECNQTGSDRGQEVKPNQTQRELELQNKSGIANENRHTQDMGITKRLTHDKEMDNEEYQEQLN